MLVPEADVANIERQLSFGASYAGIYDALYFDKDYAAEAQFALDQIRSNSRKLPRKILDLGCGTGLHAMQLALMGISVTGVDRSVDMVGVAEKRKESLPEDLRERLEFRVGDIRTIDFHRRYDAVFSLFHVISYVTEDKDLEATFQTVRRHLNVGGAFIFDFWYGPAVLRDPPRPRVKTTQVGQKHIQRKANPKWDRKRCVVCVNYDIEIKDTANGELIREREQHFVRYFFLDEIEKRLGATGFQIVRFGEWLTGDPPSDNSFGVYALAKAI